MSLGMVHALTFTDDFSGYDSFYKIISYTNAVNASNITFDANAPVFDGKLADGNDSFTVPIDVSKNGSNSGFAGETNSTQPIIDITDFNALGKIKTWFFWTDTNFPNLAQMSFAQIRIGNGPTSFWEYRLGNFGSTNGSVGKQLISVDLNSPTSTTGLPHLNDINWYQIGITYGANAQDFNFTANKLWVEKSPNAFNGVWKMVTNGALNQGGALPFNWTIEGRGMSLIDSNQASLRNRADIIVPAFDSLDTSKSQISLQADINQVDTNQGTRLLFDFVDMNNFSSCYIFDVTSTQRSIGFEKVTNGVRLNAEVSTSFSYNSKHTLQCVASGPTGTSMKTFLDGTLMIFGDIGSRVDGSIGIESFGGRSQIQNVNFTVNPIDTTSSTGQMLLAQPSWSVTRNLLLPLLFILIWIPLLYGGINSGNMKFVLLSTVLLFVAYTFLQALFFN